MGLFVVCTEEDKISKLKAVRDNLNLSLRVFGRNHLIEDFALTYLNDVIKVMEVETQQDVNLTNLKQ